MDECECESTLSEVVTLALNEMRKVKGIGRHFIAIPGTNREDCILVNCILILLEYRTDTSFDIRYNYMISFLCKILK